MYLLNMVGNITNVNYNSYDPLYYRLNKSHHLFYHSVVTYMRDGLNNTWLIRPRFSRLDRIPGLFLLHAGFNSSLNGNLTGTSGLYL